MANTCEHRVKALPVESCRATYSRRVGPVKTCGLNAAFVDSWTARLEALSPESTGPTPIVVNAAGLTTYQLFAPITVHFR